MCCGYVAVNHSESGSTRDSDQPALKDKSHTRGATGIFVGYHQPNASTDIPLAQTLCVNSGNIYLVRTHSNLDIQ